MASLPVTVSTVSARPRVSGNHTLKDFRSDYFFLRYVGPGDLTSCDRIDFALFGRSWCAIVSWAIGFVPGGKESTWRDYLPSAKSNMMGGAAFHVVGSECSHGILFATDSGGSHQRALHAVRTTVPLDKLKADSSSVASGGSLVVQINVLDDGKESGFVEDSAFTFDGQVFWNLYFN